MSYECGLRLYREKIAILFCVIMVRKLLICSASFREKKSSFLYVCRYEERLAHLFCVFMNRNSPFCFALLWRENCSFVLFLLRIENSHFVLCHYGENIAILFCVIIERKSPIVASLWGKKCPLVLRPFGKRNWLFTPRPYREKVPIYYSYAS